MEANYLTTESAAEVCSVSVQTVQNWMKKGYRGVLLRHHRIGRRMLTTRQWIADFAAAIESRASESKRVKTKSASRCVKADTKRRLARHGLK